MKPWRLLALGLLAAALAATVVYWPWIDAQRRAAIVLTTSGRTPFLSWAMRVITDDPKAEETTLAGTPTTLIRPGHGKRWRAVLLVPGTTPAGRFQADAKRLARALARAGYLVFVPDLPGLSAGEITEAARRAVIEVALEAVRRDDVVNGEIALAGSRAGASLALLAAEDPILAPRVTVVAGVAPWAALPQVIRLATTGFYFDDGELKPHESDPFLALAVARSLVAALPAGPDRQSLLGALEAVPRDSTDPLAALRNLPTAGLGADATAVVRLLTNRHPTTFDTLYAGLPEELKAQIERLSPLVGAAQIEAPVELATAGHDAYFPAAESEALQRASSHVHLEFSRGVRRGMPTLSFAGLFSVDRWLVRALKAASSD